MVNLREDDVGWGVDRWCVVVGVIDRETGDFLHVSLEKERGKAGVGCAIRSRRHLVGEFPAIPF